jgi:hypothetical protein
MSERKRRARRNRHYRIDHELKAEDLAAYRAYLREPRTTNKSAHAWLVAQGYVTFSESAVARHKRHYLDQVHDERRATERAREWALLASDLREDGANIVDGARLLSEMMAMNALLAADREKVTLEDLKSYTEMVSRLVDNHVNLARAQLAQTKAGETGGGWSPDGPDENAPAAPRLTEEQKDEATRKRLCAFLGHKYEPPEARAEQLRKQAEDQSRHAANGAAGGTKSFRDEYEGTN